MMGYGLIDKIIATTGAPLHPKHHLVPRTRIQSPSTKIDKIVQILRDWTSVLPDAERLFRKYQADAITSGIPTTTAVIRSNSSTLLTAWALNNLSKSIKVQNHERWETILCNLHIMAFLLAWYPKVCNPNHLYILCFYKPLHSNSYTCELGDVCTSHCITEFYICYLCTVNNTLLFAAQNGRPGR